MEFRIWVEVRGRRPRFGSAVSGTGGERSHKNRGLKRSVSPWKKVKRCSARCKVA
jgi:hypothetical protein